jgi:hypothetical protein
MFMLCRRLFGIAIHFVVALSVWGQSTKPREIVREPALDGLLVSISTDKVTFLDGESIVLTMTIKNPDGVPHMVHWNTTLSFLRIAVHGPIVETNSSTARAALTEDGKKATAFQPDLGVHGSILMPGQEQTKTTELTHLFHMETPGKYLVRVSAVSPSRESADGRRVGLSNEIQIFIVPRR